MNTKLALKTIARSGHGWPVARSEKAVQAVRWPGKSSADATARSARAAHGKARY